MPITVSPTLTKMAEVYASPREKDPNSERLSIHRRAVAAGTPVSLFNPMAADDVANAVELLRGMDAESEAADAANTALTSLGIDADLGALYVVVGATGMRTARWMADIEHRVAWKSPGAVYLWSDEFIDIAAVRRAAVEEVVRVALTPADIESETLTEVVRREGFALSIAESPLPVNNLVAVRAAFAEHRGAVDLGTKAAFLYGDEVAEAGGWSPMGIGDRGGLAFAKALAVTKGLGPDAPGRPH